MWEIETSKGVAVNFTCLGIIVSQFYFETGCFVYHLNVLQCGIFQIENIVPSLIK